MRPILREPLLHFVVLGALLFAVYAGVSRGAGASVQDIVVSQGRVSHLATMFNRSWRRAPSPAELSDLVDDYVREEILYREARAMGLDHDDPVIRRRLRQKLEYLAEDVAAQRVPTDDELNNLLQGEPDRFRTESRYSFRHVFLDPDRHRDRFSEAQQDLRKALTEMSEGTEPAEIGDRFLLGLTFSDMPAGELTRLFGMNFAEQLAHTPPGSWEGPVQSSYGVHFVRVTNRQQGRLPLLDEARATLVREWKERERIKANTEAFARLRSRYHVVIEPASGPSREQQP